MNKREADIEYAKIARTLKEVREAKNISRYKLAKGIGMSKSTIIYIEECKQVPKVSTLLMICDFLQIKPEDVFKKARKIDIIPVKSSGQLKK